MSNKNRRPTVPVKVQRRLYSESMGHCMNPECHTDLFRKGTFIGEMAHIMPHAEGGDVSFDNLVVLCRNCHKRIDDHREVSTERILEEWKANRNEEVRRLFSKTYNSFKELKAAAVPLLRENLKIFDSYGPGYDSSDYADRYAMWLKFEGILIANNQKLATILKPNEGLLHKENRGIIDEFIAHTIEFIKTRKDRSNSRINLFPTRLNSIFGIERVHESLAPNVSALQNLIDDLVAAGRFIDLELEPNQVVRYKDGKGKQQEIDLSDRPRVQQIYWTRRYYRSQTTNLRLDGLVFTLKWLADRDIHYDFKSPSDLTEITLNGNYKVFLCYEYCVSRAVLYKAPVSKDSLVVNLHNWNGGPFSKEAEEYATDIGATIMNQKEFFVFCHKNLL